jgi:hypothetical protein
VTTTEIVRIPFQGSELLTVEVGGKPHVVLKPAFDAIGLDADQQIRKVQRQPWAGTGVTTVPTAGGPQQMVTADIRTFLMALATIPASRVAEHARPLLIAYQSEVADAIEAYWTQGGAINPRATDEQLDRIIGRAKAQAEVVAALRGIVDAAWLDAKGRHILAVAIGEEPEVDPATRPLTVGEYLADRGVTGAALRSLSPRFGRVLKVMYRTKHGHDPGIVDRFIDNAMRPVAAYTERDRGLFDLTWEQLADVNP